VYVWQTNVYSVQNTWTFRQKDAARSRVRRKRTEVMTSWCLIAAAKLKPACNWMLPGVTERIPSYDLLHYWVVFTKMFASLDWLRFCRTHYRVMWRRAHLIDISCVRLDLIRICNTFIYKFTCHYHFTIKNYYCGNHIQLNCANLASKNNLT
jgi:hypothetical protein